MSVKNILESEFKDDFYYLLNTVCEDSNINSTNFINKLIKFVDQTCSSVVSEELKARYALNFLFTFCAIQLLYYKTVESREFTNIDGCEIHYEHAETDSINMDDWPSTYPLITFNSEFDHSDSKEIKILFTLTSKSRFAESFNDIKVDMYVKSGTSGKFSTVTNVTQITLQTIDDAIELAWI